MTPLKRASESEEDSGSKAESENVLNKYNLIMFQTYYCQQENGVNEADQLKEKGNEHYKKGEYRKAIDFYSQAIQLNSSNADFFRNRGNQFNIFVVVFIIFKHELSFFMIFN